MLTILSVYDFAKQGNEAKLEFFKLDDYSGMDFAIRKGAQHTGFMVSDQGKGNSGLTGKVHANLQDAFKELNDVVQRPKPDPQTGS